MISLDAIGERLIDLRVLSDTQWRAATLGEPDLRMVFQRLTRAGGRWFDPDAPEAPALTDYQRQLIQSAVGRGKLAKLDRKLRIGRFIVLDRIGRGGMGVVLLAWDLNRSRYVALKKVHGAAPILQKRFRREARITARLDHPSICRSLAFLSSGRAAVLVMEYIPGRNLKAEVTDRGPLPWRELAGWSADVLDGLAHAHGRGIIHRDIKPENIMLTPTAQGVRARILDMGLAKWKGVPDGDDSEINEDLTVAGRLVGTPSYMAPEQWQGNVEVGPEADIYAFGVTLFYALTGRPPFVADNPIRYCVLHTKEKPPRVADLRPDVPAALDDLVARMLAKLPRRRGTALELLWEFRQLLADTPTEPAAEEAPAPQAVSDDEAFLVFRETGDEEAAHRFTKPTRLTFQRRTVARLIPVRGHWSLYPIGADAYIWHNGEAVHGRCRLAVGDGVRLEGRDWVVEDLVALPPEGGSGHDHAEPVVEVWYGQRLIARFVAQVESLIGAADWCDLKLPEGLGLPPAWSVLTRTNRGWELSSLGGSGFSRDGDYLGPDVVLASRDAVEEGGLRLIFRAGDSVTDGSGEQDTPASDDSEFGGSGDRKNPLYRHAEKVCRQVVEALRAVSPATSHPAVRSLGLKRLFKRLTRPKDPAEELRELEAELTRAPADPDAVERLGEFFGRVGFDNLQGRLLMERCRRAPGDYHLLVQLADVYLRRATDPDRQMSRRAHEAAEAYNCLLQAQKLHPDDAELAAKVKQVAAEMTLLKGGFKRG